MSIYRLEYCTTCKRNTTSEKGICKKCGTKVNFRGYGVRVLMIDEDGREVKRALSPFPTQKAAKQAEAEFRASHLVPRRQVVKPYDITLDALFESYINYQKNRLKETTLFETVKTYNTYIKPNFGKLKLMSIDKRRIIDWQNDLDAKGYAHGTKMKLRSKFHSILNYGVLYYDLNNNVFDKVPSFRDVSLKKEMNIWTPDEFNRFLKEFDDSDMDYVCKVFFSLLYMTGCRKGEAQALSWDDIDLDNKTLSITKNLARRVDYKNYSITTPKNASSVRKIALPDSLVDTLKKYKATHDGHFVFGGDSPITDTTAFNRLDRYSERAGIKRIRIHDFRHSHASYLISQGVDVVSVAKRLGHSNIHQTLNTYAHLLDSKESQAIAALDKISF